MMRTKKMWISAVTLLGLSACGSSGGQAFSVGPGFSPDPATATGNAGGMTDASSLSGDCRGWIASSPNHVLTVTGAMPMLRIAANGGAADITLVVQRPDGTYLCNDDSDGLNPMVEGAFVPGEYKIFIGSYDAQSAGSAYRVGVSGQPTMTPTSLGAPS